MVSLESYNRFAKEVHETFSVMAEAQEQGRREKTMALGEREAERQRRLTEEYDWRGFELRRKKPVQIDED